jgi:hypothetical protein
MQAFFDPFSDHRLIAALTLRLSHDFQSLNHLTGQTYRVGDVFFPLGHLLIKLSRVWFDGIQVLFLLALLWTTCRIAFSFLRKVLAWQELRSEFITGLQRYIRHARKNVVYLLAGGVWRIVDA